MDTGSSHTNEHAFRKDVIRAARELQIRVVRWPGGNFASAYHWQDGIGPVDVRPRRWDPAWEKEEPNTFGTDEFLTYCEELGAEPYICLNMGTGTLEEALAWVEYCNGSGDTYWANRRRQGGREEPYRVRLWGLGNEMYGSWQVGHLTAPEYVSLARRWALALRRVDPEIKLVSCGKDGVSDWDREVIDGLARYVDHHSIHLYTGSHDYWANVLGPHYAERAIRIASALIDRARYLQRIDHDVTIAYDEWNVWFRARDGNDLEETYSLSDALAVATFLNIFIRNCNTVRLANQAQLVNVLAPIKTAESELLLQSIYHPLRLFAAHTSDVALDPVVRCRTITHHDLPDAPWPHRVADMGPFSLLDVAATRPWDRSRVTITVVNRAPDAQVPLSIDVGALVSGEDASAFTVSSHCADDYNGVSFPQRVSVKNLDVKSDSTGVYSTLPPHSFTCFSIGLARR